MGRDKVIDPLKLGVDRFRRVQWLFEAKKRYGLVILNNVLENQTITGLKDQFRTQK